MIGQAIHTGSDRKGKSYAGISLSGLTNEDQNRILFGDPRMGREGALIDCNHGTLMIQGVDKLTLPMQSQLARVIRTKRVASQTNFAQYRYIDVRITVRPRRISPNSEISSSSARISSSPSAPCVSASRS